MKPLEVNMLYSSQSTANSSSMPTWRPCIARPAHSFDMKLTKAQYLSGKTRTLWRLPNLTNTQAAAAPVLTLLLLLLLFV